MGKKTHLFSGNNRSDSNLATPNDIMGNENTAAESRDTFRWAINASDGL